MTKELSLSDGSVTRVDDDVYEDVSRWPWFRNAYNRISGNIKVDGKWKLVNLARYIMGNPNGFDVDHLDHDPANNTRANLRICTHRESVISSKKRENTSSKYMGVSWNKQHKKWLAKIKQRCIGFYANEDDAALAYNREASKQWGELAFVNIIGEEQPHTMYQHERPLYISRRRANPSGYRGVSTQGKRFRARVSGRKRVELGSFDTAVEAAKAYDAKAKELYGKWAILNFPEDS